MTAFTSAVAAETADVERVFELGTVPATPDYPYSVYSVTLGAGVGYTLDSASGPRKGTVTVQTFGRTEGGAADHADAITARLLDKQLPATGWETTPLRFGLEPAPVRAAEPENSGVVGLTYTFTFTATPQE